MSNSEKVTYLESSFLNSHWPKCNLLAEELLQIGTEAAKNALLKGLKAKRHHIRTAAVRALSELNDVSVVLVFRLSKAKGSLWIARNCQMT